MYARDPRRVKKIGAFLRENKFSLLAQNFPAEVSFPSTPDGAPSPALGERSGAPSGLRPSSFVMSDTPVEVQFTSAGCLNYPCRTPIYQHEACVLVCPDLRLARLLLTLPKCGQRATFERDGPS